MDESFSERDSENKNIERKKEFEDRERKIMKNELLETYWCPLFINTSAICVLPSLGVF